MSEPRVGFWLWLWLCLLEPTEESTPFLTYNLPVFAGDCLQLIIHFVYLKAKKWMLMGLLPGRD